MSQGGKANIVDPKDDYNLQGYIIMPYELNDNVYIISTKFIRGVRGFVFIRREVSCNYLKSFTLFYDPFMVNLTLTSHSPVAISLSGWKAYYKESPVENIVGNL